MMQTEGIYANNKIRSSLVNHRSRRSMLLINLIFLVIAWIALSRFFRLIECTYIINILLTMFAFIIMSIILIEAITPCLPKRVKYFLIFLVILKLILSLVYFNSAFVSYEGNVVTVDNYGDNLTHHQVAVDYSQYWSEGNLFKNPKYLSSKVEQWGYDYFLGLLYYITGPLPEVGIIINNFLFLIFYLFSYKLFIIANLPYKDSISGLLILLFAPNLWLWSSFLYKEALLYVVVIISIYEILKVTKEFKLKSLLLLIILQSLLITLRYSYVFIIIVIFFIASFYSMFNEKVNFPKKLKIILLSCLFLFILIIVTTRYDFYKYGIIEGFAYIKSGLKIRSMGGNFMTQGLGKSINVNNFFYVLPARALYIIMEPFPWFSARSFARIVDHTFRHMDTIYYLSLLATVVLTFINRQKISITKEQKLLLLTGILLFAIPLFNFYPTGRYISVCIPLLMAYALPVGLKNKNFFMCMLISIMILLSVCLYYYLK